jgi:hypothetical protein
MAISVQSRAELAVCWKIGLTNGLELGTIVGSDKITTFKFVIKLGWLGNFMQRNSA